jgi:hypothetical protein
MQVDEERRDRLLSTKHDKSFKLMNSWHLISQFLKLYLIVSLETFFFPVIVTYGQAATRSQRNLEKILRGEKRKDIF